MKNKEFVNQLSSTPKRMLGCVLMGLFGFMFLFLIFRDTGSLLMAVGVGVVIFVFILLFGLMMYCFED